MEDGLMKERFGCWIRTLPLVWMTVFFVLIVVVSGWQPASSEARPRSEKTLVVARSGEPEWLNPVAGHQHPDSDMALFRGLFKIDAKNELVPDMAQSWEVSPDGRIYTIRLRPHIRWHDGIPFTAEDVRFTIDTIQNPKNHSGLRTEVEEITKVEVVDALTVRITLSRPLAPLLGKLRIGLIPKHLLDGKDFNSDPFNHVRPVGTGPFKFAEWKRGEYLVLVANPDFYGGRPKLDRIIYKFIPDPNVRLVQLKKGEVDIALISPKQVSAIKPSDGIAVEVVEKSADYRVMMFNFRYPLFQDVRVRQAIQYATDRQALVDGALLGYGRPAYGPLQLNWAGAKEIVHHDHDIKKAEILLNEAGWNRGNDGILEKEGRRFSFHLTAGSNDPLRVDLATLLAGQLKQVGIEAVVEVKDFTSFKIQEVEALILGGGFADEPDDDLYRFFSSRLGKEGRNYSGYQNETVDRLLEEGRSTLDPEARKRIYQEIQRELIVDPPYNFLVYLKPLYAVRKGVAGFTHKIFGHRTTPLWNVEEWSVEGRP